LFSSAQYSVEDAAKTLPCTPVAANTEFKTKSNPQTGEIIFYFKGNLIYYGV